MLTDEQLIRERRCVNHRVCACDHKHCRDGWQDEPEEPATRCPHCYDAALMVAEGVKSPKVSKWGTR